MVPYYFKTIYYIFNVNISVIGYDKINSIADKILMIIYSSQLKKLVLNLNSNWKLIFKAKIEKELHFCDNFPFLNYKKENKQMIVQFENLSKDMLIHTTTGEVGVRPPPRQQRPTLASRARWSQDSRTTGKLPLGTSVDGPTAVRRDLVGLHLRRHRHPREQRKGGVYCRQGKLAEVSLSLELVDPVNRKMKLFWIFISDLDKVRPNNSRLKHKVFQPIFHSVIRNIFVWKNSLYYYVIINCNDVVLRQNSYLTHHV